MRSKQTGRILGYSVREKNGKKTYVCHTYKYRGITILKSKSFTKEEDARQFYEDGKKYRLKRINEIEAERIQKEENNDTEDNDSTSGEAGSVNGEEEVCEACELEAAALLWIRFIINKLSK